MKTQTIRFLLSSTPRTRHGFSIIEILIVLAIIGVLGSMILVRLEGARVRSRDSEREQEIKTLQSALSLHVVDAKKYPIYSGALTGSDPVSRALIASDSIKTIPLDPLNVDNYRYSYSSPDGATYTLSYSLETDTIPGKSAGPQQVAP